MKVQSRRSTSPEMADRLRGALKEVDALSERLSIPDAVRDEAACICSKSLERGLAIGKNITRISASSLYAACREGAVPTTLDDVAAASGVGKSELARCYRRLVTELELKIPIADPAEFMARVASRAKVTTTVQMRALVMLSRAEKAGLTGGKDPKGLVASALYLAAALSGEKLTQGDAAAAAGVVEATVRDECKHLRKVI